jgi:xeroderma pigmentosum group C-complementing protein
MPLDAFALGLRLVFFAWGTKASVFWVSLDIVARGPSSWAKLLRICIGANWLAKFPMPPTVPRKRRLSTSPGLSKRARPTAAKKEQGGVFKALDDLDSNHGRFDSGAASDLLAGVDDDSDSGSESSVGTAEDDFEDVFANPKEDEAKSEHDDWEDALTEEMPAEPDIQDLELTISQPDEHGLLTFKSGKKGPSKIERQIRVNTHRMHVLCLLRHNSVRNHWLNDEKLHQILLDGLTPGIKLEIERWKRASGKIPAEVPKVSPKNLKTKKGRNKQATKSDDGRDWGPDASRLEPGIPDMSAGDPTIRLLKYLAAYWKRKFMIIAPSLRKQGYRSAKERQKELALFTEDPSLPEFGERIEGLEAFIESAKKSQGSRDVGNQLFTAMLRALGLEARLIASLQPAGFGWSQVENASSVDTTSTTNASNGGPPTGTRSNPKAASTKGTSSSRTSIALDASSSELSDVDMSEDPDAEQSNTPQKPKPFDDGLTFPSYWTEVLGLSNQYIPVSIFGTPSVVTSPEGLQQFEPKGAVAEKSKQVICYVVAYYSDHAAKDVTVRYLRKNILPGKTKGFRLPLEKIPIHNSRGKITRYIEVDWFGSVMKMYARPEKSRDTADDLEDGTDLVAQKLTRAPKETGDGVPDTLQGFKTSAEYVLERHLRREEAVLPNAKLVKQFIVGKGEKAKAEPVYLRKDVVACKTVESWHKEGREIKEGEDALKHVPIRAVTWVRKMEVEQTARETGEKPLQGLYSRAQTRWIIPPPIQDGKIPKNAYGKIDIYVPSMIPQGAAHVPMRGTVRVCKKLGIDYAEACTGFEFGHQMAVPVIEGVVVAEEHAEMLVDAWKAEEERKRQKEEEKKAKEAANAKRKVVASKQIKERLNAEYGDHKSLGCDPKADAKPSQESKSRLPKKLEPELGPTFDENDGLDRGDQAAFGGGFVLEDNDLPMAVVEGPETTREKSLRGPRSLRETHQNQYTEIDEANEEEEFNGFDDSASSEDQDEEYADFAKRKPAAKHSTATRQSARITAKSSPRTRSRK